MTNYEKIKAMSVEEMAEKIKKAFMIIMEMFIPYRGAYRQAFERNVTRKVYEYLLREAEE